MSNLKTLKTSDPASKVSFCNDLTQLELAKKKANMKIFVELKERAGLNDRVEFRRGDIFIIKHPQSLKVLQQIQQQINQDTQQQQNIRPPSTPLASSIPQSQNINYRHKANSMPTNFVQVLATLKCGRG